MKVLLIAFSLLLVIDINANMRLIDVAGRNRVVLLEVRQNQDIIKNTCAPRPTKD